MDAPMVPGKAYILVTAYLPNGFKFECLSAGEKGAVGYMNDSGSWPRSVQYSEIISCKETH